MDQPYIKNNEKDVQTFVKETIAQLGENIQVRRFERSALALKPDSPCLIQYLGPGGLCKLVVHGIKQASNKDIL